MMDYLEYVVNTEMFQICFKLVLSCVLAGIIGLERSSTVRISVLTSTDMFFYP